MKLLHPEIDLVPGNPPAQPPKEPNIVGSGSATLRLVNETEQQNAFAVRIECDYPYWQESWVTMTTLQPTNVPVNVQVQRDVMGNDNHSIRATFIPAGSSRDVILSFKAPKDKESRCGVYRFRVIVDQAIRAGAPSRRLPEEHGTLIVRPFYSWTLEVSPDSQTVGRIRRSKEYDLVVTNDGNDWLNIEVKAPKPKESLVQMRTVRLTVPPPEPGGESIRRVPFRATTRLKTIMGSEVPQPLSFTVNRLDAPSVPPLPADATKTPVGAGLGSAVLAAPTTEPGVFDQPTLVYRPIPKTFTEIGKFLTQHIKGLVMAFIGLIIAGTMLVAVLGNRWKEGLGKYSLSTNTAKLGDVVTVHGDPAGILEGVNLILTEDKQNGDSYDLPIHFIPPLAGTVIIKDVLDGTNYRVSIARKYSIIPIGFAKLWSKSNGQFLTVGVVKGKAASDVRAFYGDPITLNCDTLQITQKNVSSILVDNVKVTPTSSSDQLIVLEPNPPLKVGQHDLEVKNADGSIGSFTINVQQLQPGVEPSPTNPESPSGNSAAAGPPGSGAVAGSGSNGAGGGTAGSPGTNNVSGSSSAGGAAGIQQPPNYSAILQAVETGNFKQIDAGLDESTKTNLAIKAMAAADRGEFPAARQYLSDAQSGALGLLDKEMSDVAEGFLREKNVLAKADGSAMDSYSSAMDSGSNTRGFILPWLMTLRLPNVPGREQWAQDAKGRAAPNETEALQKVSGQGVSH